jgi:hypothetical protein
MPSRSFAESVCADASFGARGDLPIVRALRKRLGLADAVTFLPYEARRRGLRIYGVVGRDAAAR